MTRRTMTRFTITMADESTAQIDCDEWDITDRNALTFLVYEGDPPEPRKIFALNASSWRCVQAADAGVSWFNPCTQQLPPQRTRVLPAYADDDR